MQFMRNIAEHARAHGASKIGWRGQLRGSMTVYECTPPTCTVEPPITDPPTSSQLSTTDTGCGTN